MFRNMPNVSNENCIGLPNGNVMKSQSAVKVVQSGRWEKPTVLALQNVCGEPMITRDQNDHVDIENLPDPHTDAAASERGAADTEVQDAQEVDIERIGNDSEIAVTNRKNQISKKDSVEYSYTPGCSK